MEGTLLKWTNYWNGWQARWFLLKDGVLSYYNTKEECRNGGCKRSFKVSLFDIIVNKSDNTRVDLIILNDQHLYIKAADYKERQKWLVALASQKATISGPTVTNSGTLSYLNKSRSNNNSNSDHTGEITNSPTQHLSKFILVLIFYFL
jgi:hypothetical protein